MKKAFWLHILMVFGVIVLSACGNDYEEDTSSDTEETDAAEEESSEEGTRTIEHAMGETEVPENPERVVVLTGDALEAVLSVGITPVGTMEATGDSELYPHLEDQMGDAVNVGALTEPNLELIQQLEPDLILGTQSRQEESYELLNEIAPICIVKVKVERCVCYSRLYFEQININRDL